MTELIALFDGTVMYCHDKEQCQGGNCCIHNPSDHVLNDKPLQYRAWSYRLGLMERLCLHGQGHPDPDDLAFKKSKMPRPLYNQYQFDIHGCDGCCRGKNDNQEPSV